jgi:hypothetical protein
MTPDGADQERFCVVTSSRAGMPERSASKLRRHQLVQGLDLLAAAAADSATISNAGAGLSRSAPAVPHWGAPAAVGHEARRWELTQSVLFVAVDCRCAKGHSPWGRLSPTKRGGRGTGRYGMSRRLIPVLAPGCAKPAAKPLAAGR